MAYADELVQETERLVSYFKENPDTDAYFSVIDVDGNSKIMQAVVTQARKLGKALYIFSVDKEGGKVVHVNHVPEFLRAKGVDARQWASSVAEVIGGKVRLRLIRLG